MIAAARRGLARVNAAARSVVRSSRSHVMTPPPRRSARLAAAAGSAAASQQPITQAAVQSVDRAKRKRKPAVQNDGVSQSGTPTHTPTPDYADRGSHSFYPGGWSLSLSSVLTGIFWRRRRWWFGGLCRVRAQEEERTAHRCRY